MTHGRVTRLLIEIPIRHGKSELTTIRYGIYRLSLNPAMRVCVVCHTATLAEKFGRKARALARECRIALDETRTAVADWHTAAGGCFRAVGVGGTIIGEGFDLILCDDLLASRQEAESASQRDKVWEYFSGDMYGRLEPGGQIALTMSRWHESDPIGRCIEGGTGDEWDVVRLPALAEENDPLGRSIGEALWPERWPAEYLRQRQEAKPYEFASQYQQRPSPPEGGLFRPAMLGRVDVAPAGLPSHRAWDLAYTENDGDYTAGVKISGPDSDGFWYVDPTRFRHEPAERNRRIRQTAEDDGRAVKITVPQDPSAGKETAGVLVTVLAGYVVESVRPRGSKVVRAEGFAAQVNAGKVRVVTHGTPEGRKAAAEYVNEIAAFPYGSHDDQIDSSSDAFAALAPTIPDYPALTASQLVASANRKPSEDRPVNRFLRNP